MSLRKLPALGQIPSPTPAITKRSRNPSRPVSKSRLAASKRRLRQSKSRATPTPDLEDPDFHIIDTTSPLLLDDVPNPNNAVVQLHHLINSVLRIRETEERKLEERYQDSLSQLDLLDTAFSSAKAKARLANDRLYAVRTELISLANLECTSADVQHVSEYLDLVEEDKTWMIAYRNIASSLADQKSFLDRIRVEAVINHRAFPPLESILAVASAAQEEACAEKVAAEHRFRTRYLQCHVHGNALEKTKKIRKVAEQALALIATEFPLLSGKL
ncbi:hypothetical protein BJ138DRAFT_1131097 [Hygrophoropsis aurantiaca]|uniref:Uncharacterized protein n=1 Tax=Hygrophoropsis aurantiaca TaxID=72124 RepID=A0ACB7ZSE9_9AGAM|nr:hypothetical protein BJ138DRAFT_1131097 [Hygrophoropsis aurantiaca]